MPTAVACPKCNARYSLPDELVGKPVKCKACGTVFKSNPAVAPAGQAGGRGQANAMVARKRAVARAKPPVSNEEFARAGLDGPIKESVDLFNEQANPQFDPLSNHIVHDPGFAEFEVDDDGEDNDTDTEISQVLRNTAIRKKVSTSKKKEDPLAQYLEGDALMGIEEADEDIRSTMNVTASTLWGIGAWWSVLAGLQWAGVFETDHAIAVSMYNTFSAATMILTAFFVFFRVMPVPFVILGAITFFTLQTISAINYPNAIFDGMVYKGLSGIVFVLGIVVAFRYRAEQKERQSVKKKKRKKKKKDA